MIKQELLEIQGVGEATSEKILKAIADGEDLAEKFGVKIASAVSKLRKTEKKKDWKRVTDMRIINLIKDQIKVLEGEETNLENLITRKSRKEDGAAKGNIKLGNTNLFLSTIKAKKKNAYLTTVYQKDDEGNWNRANFYIMSYQNEDTNFINAGTLPHKE